MPRGEAFRSPYRIRIDDAIECMVATLGEPGPHVLLCSTLDERGFVGPGNCFALDEALPSVDVVFHLALSLGAPAVLCGSRATHSVLEPDERDFELTRWLLAGAAMNSVFLDEHILVQGKMFRAMKESIERDDC